jgi:hypothetical protein
MAPAYLVTVAIVYNGVAESRRIWMRSLDVVEQFRQHVHTDASQNKFILTSFSYVFEEAPDCVFDDSVL